jgi:hypothetical protein
MHTTMRCIGFYLLNSPACGALAVPEPLQGAGGVAAEGQSLKHMPATLPLTYCLRVCLLCLPPLQGAGGVAAEGGPQDRRRRTRLGGHLRRVLPHPV